jgi:hypothetical protein
MNEPQPIVRFSGGVSCLRDTGPLGLTLIGRTTDQSREVANLVFATQAPHDLPEALEDATVERVDAGHYRISSEPREWLFPASAHHLHRDIAASFYEAVIPRVAPRSKRIFLRVALALASTSSGKRLLLALRRR